MKKILNIAVGAILLLGSFAQAAAQEYVPAEVTVSSEKVKLKGKVYYSHVVLERQTLFSIAKAYGVSVEDIYSANPGLKKKGLQKNSIILIPYVEAPAQVETPAPSVQAEPAKETAAEPDGNFVSHTVKWYEDINDIAKRYGVSVKDIMDANSLTGTKLSSRQVLRIPVVLADAPAPAAAPETVPEAAPAPADSSAAEPVQPADTLSRLGKELVRASLVLPLNAGGSVSALNMDFYSGVLMAMKDFEKEGVKVRLETFDLTEGIPRIEVIAADDFVLGPIASREVEAMLQRTEGRVRLVSPLDQKTASLTQNYQGLIQVPSSAENQYTDLAAWAVSDTAEGDKLIYICEKGAGNASAAIGIRKALATQENLVYEIFSYAILDGREITEKLQEVMTLEGVNRVIAASESEAFVDDIVRNLGIMMGKGYDVVMYAPSKVRSFDTVDSAALHDVNLHVSTSYYADYSAPETQRFVKEYRSLFNSEPSQFALQGYDTARFFVKNVSVYGDNWIKGICNERYSGLHTDFLFKPLDNGCFANTAVRRIIYNKDYTISPADGKD